MNPLHCHLSTECSFWGGGGIIFNLSDGSLEQFPSLCLVLFRVPSVLQVLIPVLWCISHTHTPLPGVAEIFLLRVVKSSSDTPLAVPTGVSLVWWVLTLSRECPAQRYH